MSRTVRCAIYTRKSSDEGLDQSFNSLDAQREAGEAYVLSQASEGWKSISTRYDDGGFSGGTLERPGLQRLLTDIEAGRIDVVVVYKIDRLTRSLSDFSRIVEIFEKADTSFVSVTQSFNTTNSMGRLMLNVLLSFAQFEREVTGERIRDKIAAAKAKGMWMGGLPPLGYDVPAPGTRRLRVNETEAEVVRRIFSRYLDLGSVHMLQRELASENIRSKRHVTAAGKEIGGQFFSRGALFHLLRNRIYLGQIVHGQLVYPGEHQPILDESLFERVQIMLNANMRRRSSESTAAPTRSPLIGKLFDADSQSMSPTFSRGKSGRTYRYYVSAPLQQGAQRSGNAVRRVPAQAIEQLIDEAAGRWLPAADRPLEHITAVRLTDGGLLVDLRRVDRSDLILRLAGDEQFTAAAGRVTRIRLPVAFPLRGGRQQVQASSASRRPDPTLIAALRKAHRLVEREQGMPLARARPESPYDRVMQRLAFLAPDIQRDILAGRQPRDLNLERLRKIELPLDWSEQRKALGWPNEPHPVMTAK